MDNLFTIADKFGDIEKDVKAYKTNKEEDIKAIRFGISQYIGEPREDPRRQIDIMLEEIKKGQQKKIPEPNHPQNKIPIQMQISTPIPNYYPQFQLPPNYPQMPIDIHP